MKVPFPGAIDCDIHPAVPSTRALLPYLDAFWHEHLVNRYLDRTAFTLTSYPPNSPLSARPDRRSKAGPPGADFDLLRAQARATGVELVEIPIPAGCVNATYEERMEAALGSPPLDQVPTVAFGDLFLEDVRAYREERLTGAGRSALFPLWRRDTAALAREFIDAGFEAILVSVDPDQLDRAFVGRSFDEALLADLPAGVDPCGENGEFHTFVHAGPVFEAPIEVERGEVVTRDGFAFQDLLLR